MATPTDELLLAEHLEGSSQAFELLVRRYAQELFQFLYRLLGSAAAAEDATQETFLQLHLSAASFDGSRRLRPWVFTIAANKARDAMRGRKRRGEVPLDAALTGEDKMERPFADLMCDVYVPASLGIEEEERSFQIRRLVDQLPTSLKEVLILAYYHGFPYKEMARILDIPLGTVKSRLHAAVAGLGHLQEQAGAQALIPDGGSSRVPGF